MSIAQTDLQCSPANATSPSALADGEVTENQINSEIELLTSKDLLTQIVKEWAWLARRPAGCRATGRPHAE